ncbi:MAG TPA: transketolase C-terminal domain-containing protein, partial [Alphaproteobacteria bacterium]|nr:transketolase C-terminal domain-containing protein [Alphaproteobacteria bacterium]
YGIREHAMSACMNGLALYGFIPYGGTFFVFSDYLKPALRLSAMMGLKVVYVLTHDSIGLGEDGPTHQPIEHLTSLRSIPGVQVLRPADALETLRAWKMALDFQGPTVLALSRQSLPSFERLSTSIEDEFEGGYCCLEDANPEVTLFASGSEVSLALKTAQNLKEQGKNTRVISVLCLEKFLKTKFFQRISADCSHKVAIEAAHPMPWYQVVGQKGQIFGIETFGASAPFEKVYEHFGLTPKNITTKVLAALTT